MYRKGTWWMYLVLFVGALLLSFVLTLIPRNAYPADIVFWATNKPQGAIPTDVYRGGVIKKGDVYECNEDGATPTPPPSWNRVVVRVPGITVEQCKNYRKTWRKVLDYTTLNSNLALDGYRISVFTVTPGVSGIGNLTLANVTAFLDEWNCTFQSATANSVVFDIGVYQSAISNGFWERDVSSVVFAELGYVQGTGIHTIQADYSASPFAGKTKVVENAVRKRGASITSHASSVVTFDIHRSEVLGWFKAAVKEGVEDNIYLGRHYVEESEIDNAIAAGRDVTLTPTQLLNRIKDRRDDP